MRAEDVPNFVGDWPTRWYARLVDWLRPMGLVVEHEGHDPSPRPPYRPAGWWIASVQSENFEGETHAVVMRGTFTPDDGASDWMAVAHDPSPHPRRTPYVFVGRYSFVALDPAAIARASGCTAPSLVGAAGDENTREVP